MRDHPYHKTEILAGMWGCRRGILEGIGEMMQNYTKADFWQDIPKQFDQNFLREKIWPLVKDDTFTHDEFFNQFSTNPQPYPYPRDSDHFIGQAYDGNDKILDADSYFKDSHLEEKKL